MRVIKENAGGERRTQRIMDSNSRAEAGRRGKLPKWKGKLRGGRGDIEKLERAPSSEEFGKNKKAEKSARNAGKKCEKKKCIQLEVERSWEGGVSKAGVVYKNGNLSGEDETWMRTGV